jgi:hypothetical protein
MIPQNMQRNLDAPEAAVEKEILSVWLCRPNTRTLPVKT